jgi:hypothetical protein
MDINDTKRIKVRVLELNPEEAFSVSKTMAKLDGVHLAALANDFLLTNMISIEHKPKDIKLQNQFTRVGF